MRTIEELTQTEDPAWPLVLGWIQEATNHIEVLPATEPNRRTALLALQITTRSPMGAVVFETGGLLVDHGWLRILGSSHERLPRSLPEWNFNRTWIDRSAPPPLLLVADDVLGGFFAIDGGGLTGAAGSVHYFAPDTLAWEDLELSYSGFLGWAFSGDLATFYEASRWSGWQSEIAELPGDRALSVYPPLWAAGPPIAHRDRRPVPLDEHWSLEQDLRKQLGHSG